MTWFQINTFMHPWLLLLAPLIVLLFVLECFARAPGAISISTGETLRRVASAKRAVLRRLPALRREMPASFAVMAVGCASMAGLPPLLGFVSKESIFTALRDAPGPAWIGWAAMIAGATRTMRSSS